MIMQMQRSIIAFATVIALNFLSMGMLGLVLYYVTYPVLFPIYGDINDWRGDWVWPTVLVAGWAWACSFLLAGYINLRLERRGMPQTR